MGVRWSVTIRRGDAAFGPMKLFFMRDRGIPRLRFYFIHRVEKLKRALLTRSTM